MNRTSSVQPPAAPDASQAAPSEILPLWQGTPPGGDGTQPDLKITDYRKKTTEPRNRFVEHISAPDITVFRPEKPNGAAILLCAGGAYYAIAIDIEGLETARRFAAAGYTVFNLRYRLPHDGWKMRKYVPLQDAQRAIRLIRAHAGKYGIDPESIGVFGFSAGGHLAASLTTRFATRTYAPRDAADALSARPDFTGLIYPVITMGAGTHEGSRDNLLGPDPAPEEIAEASCEKLVSKKTPPTFIALAADDPAVPPYPNGIAMFDALQKDKIPSELHVFEKGGHGFGIRKTAGLTCAAWPELFLAWARGKIA